MGILSLCSAAAANSWSVALSLVSIIVRKTFKPRSVVTTGLINFQVAVYYIKQFMLHPLAAYPGPVLARCTNLYAAYHGWRGSVHTDMYQCHRRYGPVVRYGPNRLLIDTNTAVKDIYGHNVNNIKSNSYRALIHSAPNTLTIRRKEEHSWRRRILSLALADSRISHYQHGFEMHIQRLCENLGENAKFIAEKSKLQPLDMSEQCEYFSFDIMSDAIFGVKYNTLTEPTYRFVSKALEDSNMRISALFQAPMLKIGKLDKYLFSKSIQGRNKFLGFISSLLLNRSALSGDGSVFSFLESAKDPIEGHVLDKSQVRAECATLVVAGSDTASTALASTLFYLSRNPAAYGRVAEEVRGKFQSPDQIILGPLLNSCTYLRACIDEALRMSPPVGSALWREVGLGGMMVDTLMIPAGVDVGVGIYSLHHNDKYHSEPFKYQPERWLADDELSTKEAVELSRSAFVPFSIGPRSCVGKGFAYHQMTLTLAHIIYKFEFSHANDMVYSSWSRAGDREEFLLQDRITGAKTGPFLRFKLHGR
ncbi:putative cytochrome P450 [Trichoderma evansii]